MNQKEKPTLTHLDDAGRVRMVDVGDKADTSRLAVARGEIIMSPEVFEQVSRNRSKKGNVLETARIAGVMAAKRTAELIPMCHSLNLDHVSIDFTPCQNRHALEAEARVRLTARTGVEMEALTAVSVALLTIYDMCKAVDRGMVIGRIRLLEKAGGKSGHWLRDEAGAAGQSGTTT